MSRSIRARRASSVSRRTRGIPTTSVTRARPNRSRCGKRSRVRPRPIPTQAERAGTARQRADRVLPDLAVRRRGRPAVRPARCRPEAPSTTPASVAPLPSSSSTPPRSRCCAASSTSRSSRAPRRWPRSGRTRSAASGARTRSSPTRSARFPWESPPDPVEIAHEVFQAWLTFAVFDNARRARDGVGLDEYRAALGEMLAPMTTVAAAQSARLVPGRPHRGRDRHARAREPHGRLPVHEVLGRGHGRRHGRRVDRRDARTRRRARRARRSARVSPRLVLRDRSRPRRRASRLGELTGDGAASAEALRIAGIGIDDVVVPRSLLLLRQLAALRVRCARASLRPMRVASPSPAACRITVVPRADT